MFHKTKEVKRTEINTSHTNFPGGTVLALQLICYKRLEIKAAYDILGDASKRK